MHANFLSEACLPKGLSELVMVRLSFAFYLFQSGQLRQGVLKKFPKKLQELSQLVIRIQSVIDDETKGELLQLCTEVLFLRSVTFDINLKVKANRTPKTFF